MKRKMVKRERTNYATDIKTTDTITDSMSLKEAFNEFLLAKRAERTAPRTIRDYQTHFRYLCTWLDSHYPGIRLSQISTKILLEYIDYMSNEKIQYDDHPRRHKAGIIGLSPMTVNVRIRTMKAFFNWLYKNRHITEPIASGIKLQKVDNDRIMAFTPEQVRKLLDAPDKKSFTGFRDYVVMMTLLDTGLRISELFSLTKADVDFEELTLTVPWEKAKTRKTRTVPISKRVARLLAELIRENEDFGPNANKLFYSAYGNDYTPKAFDERLREYGRQAKIEGVRISAHTFRHTFAVEWIKAGGDPFSLQKMLGHTDMSMVRRYVRFTEGDVKLVHNKFSPINTIMGKIRG